MIEKSTHYRSIGSRLAVYIRKQHAEIPSSAILQSLAADLAAGDADLVLPLKDLVTRPAFRSLTSKAGSGGGSLERHALLLSMQTRYAPQVLDALGEVLSGFLDLPKGSDVPSTAPESREAERHGPHASATSQDPRQHEGQTSPPEPHAERQVKSASPRTRLPVLTALATATAVCTAFGAVLLSNPQLCRALGVCAGQSVSTATERALQAAEAAAQDLRRAKGLADYRQATEQLERELLKLSGDSLTSKQQQERQSLEITAKQARSILGEEEADRMRLDRASQALDAAEALAGQDRLAPLESARQSLGEVPPRSFSAAEAGRLRERLLELESAASPGPTAVPEPVAPASPSPSANRAQAAQPAPRSVDTPQRVPRRQTPTGAGTAAPYRDEPLF
jgi:hypothetical protein